MGLDMYLLAEKYVGGWKEDGDDEKSCFKQILKLVGTEKLVASDSPSLLVRTNVAYWRKVNAVHAWFVRELADGVDERQSIPVPVEAMERLVVQCKEALLLYEAGRIKEAGECMPPQGGFFFGDTAVDEVWVEGLKKTIEQLEPLIKIGGDFDFCYQASW